MLSEKYCLGRKCWLKYSLLYGAALISKRQSSVPRTGSNRLSRIGVFGSWHAALFFRKTVVGVLHSEKLKANRKVMVPSYSSSPGLGEEEGVQHTGFQPTRTGYGSSCKHFTFGWRGNFSTSVCWCFANCSCFRGTFSTCAYLDKAKYFCLGFLEDSWTPLCASLVVQRFLEFFGIFVEFLCTDSEEDFTYMVANFSLTG